MSRLSKDLENYLDVVAKVALAFRDEASDVEDARGSLASAGILDLASDVVDEPDALHWLAHTISKLAESSPSLAYVVAARYAGRLAIGAETETDDPTFSLSSSTSSPVVARALDPRTVVVLEANSPVMRSWLWSELEAEAVEESRTGLTQARLVTLTLPDGGRSRSGEAHARTAWNVLTTAALVGTARCALATTQGYVLERHQFGVPIGSFAGLRALVADMDLKAEAASALLDLALDDETSAEHAAAAAGRSTVEVCLAAVQAHGGYGYIDEYPLAGLLRDAISLQARAGGRRLHVAGVARRGLGPRPGAPA